jgi:hypothetical protein
VAFAHSLHVSHFFDLWSKAHPEIASSVRLESVSMSVLRNARHWMSGVRNAMENAAAPSVDLDTQQVVDAEDVEQAVDAQDVNMQEAINTQHAVNTVAIDTLAIDTLVVDTLAVDTLAVDTLVADALGADALAANTLPTDTLPADTLAADTLAADAQTAGKKKDIPPVLRERMLVRQQLKFLNLPQARYVIWPYFVQPYAWVYLSIAAFTDNH